MSEAVSYTHLDVYKRQIAHTKVTPPSCETFVAAEGDTFKVVFNRGKDIWVCFPSKGLANLNQPVPPPPGAPGT